MPIRKRGSRWHYEFMKSGKRYSGVCEGCSTQKQAEDYLNNIKKKQGATATARNVEQLYEIRHQEITGNAGIALADAFDESLKYSTRRPSEKKLKQKINAFADFVAFMSDKHPEIKNISEVGINHANEYSSFLINNGRYKTAVQYVRDGKTVTVANGGESKLANSTINYYISVCAEVFEKLKIDAGLVHNPFSQFRRLPKQEEQREIFSEDEVKLICDNLTDFVRPLFIVAFNTAMREGDICTLRWSEVNLKEGKIRRGQNKTVYKVEIPIMPELKDFLTKWQQELADRVESVKRNNPKTHGKRMSAADCEKYEEYVFPEHAKMYRENPSGVSYRIKEFLEKLGIKTTRTPAGRTRAVSVKDLHSCRHTFCKRAADAGVPLTTVQAIVGHMTQAMTEHYSAHATFADKQKAIAAMAANTDTRRLEILGRLSKLPTDTLEALLKQV